MKYTVTDISYDFGGQDMGDTQLPPSTLEINVPEDFEHPEDIDQYISDQISDITGWCHMGYSTTPEVYP